MLNLLSANTWVERVSCWVGDRSAAQVAGALNIPDLSIQGPPLLFVLSRHASHFTGADTFDHRAAWLGWAHVLQFVRNSGGSDPLRTMFDEFRGGGKVAMYRHRAHQRFEFPGLVVEVKIG